MEYVKVLSGTVVDSVMENQINETIERESKKGSKLLNIKLSTSSTTAHYQDFTVILMFKC